MDALGNLLETAVLGEREHVSLTRRTLLASMPAVGLATVVGGAVASPAAAAPPVGPEDTEALLANATTLLAGTADINRVPAVAAKVEVITANARNRLDLLDRATGDQIFADLTLGSDEAALARAFTYVSEIALATATPTSPLVGDVEVTGRALATLNRLQSEHYADADTGYYGNWFQWEIGIPTTLTRTLVLTRSTVDPELVQRCVAAMDGFLLNGKDGDVDLDSRFHTGANLADITGNRVLQGALTGDAERISKALTDQRTVFATVDPDNLQHGVTDGYYADGSFIQHHSVAYTGSYGRALLTRVMQTLGVLRGTAWGDDGTLIDTVLTWVGRGFAPLVAQGWMMEAVKGRAVSRTASGYTDVAAVAEAVVALTEHAPEVEWLRPYAKHLLEASGTDPARLVSPPSIALATEILADGGLVGADAVAPTAHHHFAAMERSVHRRPGWTFTLSRSSDRISKYEYMSSENLRSWFQGEGVHQLYLTDQDHATVHGVDGLVLHPAHGLPGLVAPDEERLTVPELYGRAWYENPDHPLGFTSSSESQNTYVYFPTGTHPHSGGAVLGDVGSAAMVLSDDVAHRDSQRGLLPGDLRTWANARAVRSWFFLDDGVVLLAAGVGDVDGRDVLVTLDRRRTEAAVVVGEQADGRPWSGAGSARLQWLLQRDGDHSIGYRLLQAPQVQVGLDRVSASRRSVRTSNPDTLVESEVFSLTARVPAGKRPGAFAWSIHPGADEASLAARTSVSVLENSTTIQAVADRGSGLVGINTFTAGWHRSREVAVEGPASVLLRPTREGLSLAVADPTTQRSQVRLRLPRRYRVVSDRRCREDRHDRGSELTVDVRGRYGRSVEISLRRR